jgi:hypothetical protein
VLSEGDIAPPIRGPLRKQRNARVSGPRKQNIEQRIGVSPDAGAARSGRNHPIRVMPAHIAHLHAQDRLDFPTNTRSAF